MNGHGVLVSPIAAVPAPSTAAPGVAAAERREPAYRATIRRTTHRIPHITADSFADLGFGSGYAAVQTSACTLVDTVITARGDQSRWFGPGGTYNDQGTLQASNLQVDAFVTDLRNRKVVEKLLADRANGPSRQARAMVRVRGERRDVKAPQASRVTCGAENNHARVRPRRQHIA